MSNWDGYGTATTAADGQIGKRLHYVELDQSFGQLHSRARREARRHPDRGQSCLSDDEGMKRRAKAAAIGSDCEVEGFLAGGGGGETNGLVFGAFEDDRLNLRHFKDKYFLQPTGPPATATGSRNAAKGNTGGSGRTPKGSDTQDHPQQLKSQNSSTKSTDAGGGATVVSATKRTQYATLNFNEVNI